ncbi:uncharacterized protein LOC134831355 [Culicoides brevitarsis]|uniref:uncharacterized protein LOC134831355 n=1 Tax=Culicoides brevitarsis TaxID=469753 RepID=UPI00307B7F4F
MQCLEVGQEKYTIRKCEAGVKGYENGTKLAFHCLEGGQLSGRTLRQCINGTWDVDEVPSCQKTCPELIFNPIKTNVSCDNERCFDRQIVGTKVYISCQKPDYERPKSIKHHEIECLEDGNWSAPIYDCIKIQINVKDVLPLNTGGIETEINKVPYHAAIYGRKKNGNPFLKCGSTIISQRVVVTAAHCFFRNAIQQENSKYFVVAGKFHRTYNDTSDQNTQESEISEIYIHDSYKAQDLFRDDVALVILETPLHFTPIVQKAQVDLDFNEFHSGNVSGWGKNASQNVLETLHTVKLEVVSCLNELSEKFCAGGNEGQTVCQGDSGGGFIVEREGINYVVGVVSTSSDKSLAGCNPDMPATFNKLAPYLYLFQKAKRYLLLFENCEDYKFKCNSGKCINIEQLCDGIIDCDQDGLAEDEAKVNCNLLATQKMLSFGAKLLENSKFYENRYPNWIVPTSALWITANFLSQSVKDEEVQKKLQLDFGISVIDKGDEMLQNIQNSTIYQSEFLHTRGEIQITNETLAKKYLLNIKPRRKGPPEFFYPDLYRIGVHLNSDFSFLVKSSPRNFSFFVTNDEVVQVPMFCFNNKKSSMAFVKELNSDVSSLPMTSNLKLYILVPKTSIELTLKALRAFNLNLIEEQLYGNSKEICIPEFKIITSVDYSPILFKLGYDYAFNLDPIELNNVNRHSHFQTNIRGFFGITEDENYPRTNVVDTFNNNSYIINKPFIFVVTEEITKSIAFMGNVRQPHKYTRYANAYAKCKIFSETQCT